MSLFRKRLSSPNQLATMRELEAQVDVGRVRLGSLGNALLLSGVVECCQLCCPQRCSAAY